MDTKWDYHPIVSLTPWNMSQCPRRSRPLHVHQVQGLGMPFLVKRTIAHSITLGESIGGGRFGQVYLGYYQGEQFAVKKFFSKDEQSWFHESDIYNTFNLRHENILSCFATDMFSNNGVNRAVVDNSVLPSWFIV